MARGRSARGLSRASIADLHAEIGRRTRGLNALVKRRNKLAANLEAMDEQISRLEAAMGVRAGTSAGRTRTGGRRRAKNPMNLVAALSKLLDGKAMNVTEIAQKVQEAGYKTTSPNFRTIVNQTLINSGQFKRTGRGVYTAK